MVPKQQCIAVAPYNEDALLQLASAVSERMLPAELS